MVSPAIRRLVVGHIVKAMKLSERRACRAIGVQRSSIRYESHREEPTELITEMRELAKQRPRYGYRRLHDLLVKSGHKVNRKRVYRLYRRDGLAVRSKRRRRFAASPRTEIPKATQPNEVWSMDFVSDHLASGRRFRILTVVDRFSRRCPGVLIDTSIPGGRVARFLDELAARVGAIRRSSPSTTVPSSSRTRSTSGPRSTASPCASVALASPSTTRSSKASTAASATSASTRAGSTRSTRQRD